MITASLAKQVGLQFDQKPEGAVIRLNVDGVCKLRICNIPKEQVFDDEGIKKGLIDIVFDPKPQFSELMWVEHNKAIELLKVIAIGSKDMTSEIVKYLDAR